MADGKRRRIISAMVIHPGISNNKITDKNHGGSFGKYLGPRPAFRKTHVMPVNMPVNRMG